MKLAIFGDSYADTNGDVSLASWPNRLRKYIPDTYIKGLCGTSSWWSYMNFTEYLERNKPDAVIFCHTNPYRWPSLPEELEGSNWNIHSNDNPSLKPLLKDMNKHYLDLYNIQQLRLY